MAVKEERVALVTGSGKGVGAGIVRVFTAAGIKCCINCNSNRAMAEETLKAVQEAGGEAFIYQADVSDPAQVQAMVQAVIEKYGRLDILVNNAAMQPNQYIDEYTTESLQKLWNINFGGYWRCAKAAIPYIRQSPLGRIVNICSVHGKRPTCFDAGYAMTKGAIRMFTRELSLELARDNITVNAITLGSCRVEFKTGHPKWPMKSPKDTTNPAMKDISRTVYPVDVGNTVLYLCSEEASAMTGDCLRIDRGLMLV